MVKYWSTTGQVRKLSGPPRWSNTGQILVKYWSTTKDLRVSPDLRSAATPRISLGPPSNRPTGDSEAPGRGLDRRLLRGSPPRVGEATSSSERVRRTLRFHAASSRAQQTLPVQLRGKAPARASSAIDFVPITSASARTPAGQKLVKYWSNTPEASRKGSCLVFLQLVVRVLHFCKTLQNRV
jgi:hypothetical protein